tara:strand:+ start:941 stop:1717 length:777 start_codon:yes stop_codon:yes gene_type:complete
MRYATGKRSLAICDRCGQRYRYPKLRKEWTGLKTCPDCFEPKHPQLEPSSVPYEPQVLHEPRPDIKEVLSVTITFPVVNGDTFSLEPSLPILLTSVGTVTFGGDVITPITSTVTGVAGTGAVGTVTASGTGGVTIAATYTVTVVGGNPLNHPYYNVGSANKFAINGSTATSDVLLSLSEGSTYKFDQSDSSNSGHPLRFSTTANGTHGGGSQYTTGVTTSGTPGSAGAYTQITVASGAPTLYYYCTNHSGMGWQANTP